MIYSILYLYGVGIYVSYSYGNNEEVALITHIVYISR